MKPKILILGHGGHGKGTVAKILEKDYGLKAVSSSDYCNEHVVYPALKGKYGYSSPAECYADRRNHREEWAHLISKYNDPDKSRVAREILEIADIYDGMRRMDEFKASRDMFDYILFVDASRREPPDPTMEIGYRRTMDYIDNNWDIDLLQLRIDEIPF